MGRGGNPQRRGCQGQVLIRLHGLTGVQRAPSCGASPFPAISCREQRRGLSRSPGWLWPCPPTPPPPPSNPGLCTARRSPGPAGPRAPRGGVGRAGRRAGWGWGWRKGRTSPHPAERLARGQPRSAAPERCRGPARIGEHLVPRSLPNRYPPRRQTAGGEPGSEPCPRPGGRTHTHRHTQTGEGEQQTRPPQSDGSRQRGFLLAITSPMPPRGACGARRHHPHIPPPPPLFWGVPPNTHLANGPPRALEVISSGGGRGVGAASGLGVVGTTGIPVYIETQINVLGAATEGESQCGLPQTDRQTYPTRRVCMCLCI